MKLPRSTKGIKRWSKKERGGYITTEKVKETLIGIILVDGHIVQRSSTLLVILD
jgi:hypothetical protein